MLGQEVPLASAPINTIVVTWLQLWKQLVKIVLEGFTNKKRCVKRGNSHSWWIIKRYLLILWASMDGGEKVETGALDTLRVVVKASSYYLHNHLGAAKTHHQWCNMGHWVFSVFWIRDPCPGQLARVDPVPAFLWVAYKISLLEPQPSCHLHCSISDVIDGFTFCCLTSPSLLTALQSDWPAKSQHPTSMESHWVDCCFDT